jgi:hypothetical protein
MTVTSARFIPRLVGTVAVAATAAGVALCGASPASANDETAGQYIAEKASYSLSGGDGTLTAVATEFFANGRLQVQIDGNLAKTTTPTNCLVAQVTWKYADGSSKTVLNNYRSCSRISGAMVHLHSDSGKDAVRYTIDLRVATDMTSAGIAQRSATYFVGGTDGVGTADRVDRDALSATHSGRNVFTGQNDFMVARNAASIVTGQSWTMQGHLTGRLIWSDTLPGVRAKARVTWLYFDGSSNTVTGGTVARGGAPVDIDVVSNVMKELATVRVEIVPESDSGASLGTAASTGTAKLGEYQPTLK